MISQNNKPEVLSFTYQDIYLSRKLIKSREHLIKYLKFLSIQYCYPIDKIIFNHDFEDEFRAEFINNFKLNGSYDYLREELLKRNI